MKNKLFLFTLALFFTTQAIAQKGYIPIRIGIQYAQAKDDYFSPIPYSGFATLFGTGVETVSSTAINRYAVNGAFGSMKARMEEGRNLAGQEFGYFYNNVHYAPNLGDLSNTNQYFVGFSWKLHFGSRSSRNQAMDVYTSLNFTASAARSGGRADAAGNRIEAGVQIPLVAYVLRPQFAVPMYGGKDKPFKNANVKLMTINKLQALDFYVHFTDYLESSNAYRFSYEWQYYRINDLHTVNALNQNLNFEILWAY